jgi:protein involved in polysaccharide export with SLBB domain
MSTTIVRAPLLLLTLVGALWAQQQTSNAPSSMATPGAPTAASAPDAAKPTLQDRTPRYRIRSGDVIQISFAFASEFDQSAQVQPDGYINLKEVNDLYVAGMTLPIVRQAIAKAYEKTLNHPEITVELKDYEKPYFVATGQVVHPGKYELRGDVRLTEGIAIAGGFNEAAKHSNVVLYRHVSPDLMQAHVVNVKKMLASHDLNEDYLIKPGDLIYVPQSTSSKIMKYIPTPGIGVPIP